MLMVYHRTNDIIVGQSSYCNCFLMCLLMLSCKAWFTKNMLCLSLDVACLLGELAVWSTFCAILGH
jgi:hypothetical protein